MIKKLLNKHEFYLAVTIVVLSIVIGTVNNVFFTTANLFDLLKSSIVMGIFSLGVFIVIVSGGIDVSFTAIAAFGMYVTSKLLKTYGFEGSILAAFMISICIGIFLGIINAWFISKFKLPTLIVTLGTQNLFRGFLLAFIGTRLITNLPRSMVDLSRSNILSVKQGRMIYGLPSSILILFFLVVITWVIIRYTKIGRGVFAVGGDPVAAERVGFNIKRIQFFIYSYVGFLAGIAGIVHASLIRVANPFDLVGDELSVIAAVVLGGTKITGGEGSIMGTLLGVLLITIINNSLILLGVSSYWQRFVIGLLILISIGITTYRDRKDVSKAYA